MAAALTVHLDERTFEALDRLAEQTERSRNELVARAIEDYVTLNEWQIDKIEIGIRAAERGQFASDSEVARARSKFWRG